jgi:hypothetical protein
VRVTPALAVSYCFICFLLFPASLGLSFAPGLEWSPDWVKLVTGATAMSEYQNTCTPGYYNGEGTNEGQDFPQTNYPDGGLAFFAGHFCPTRRKGIFHVETSGERN